MYNPVSVRMYRQYANDPVLHIAILYTYLVCAQSAHGYHMAITWSLHMGSRPFNFIQALHTVVSTSPSYSPSLLFSPPLLLSIPSPQPSSVAYPCVLFFSHILFSSLLPRTLRLRGSWLLVLMMRWRSR